MKKADQDAVDEMLKPYQRNMWACIDRMTKMVEEKGCQLSVVQIRRALNAAYACGVAAVLDGEKKNSKN